MPNLLLVLVLLPKRRAADAAARGGGWCRVVTSSSSSGSHGRARRQLALERDARRVEVAQRAAGDAPADRRGKRGKRRGPRQQEAVHAGQRLERRALDNVDNDQRAQAGNGARVRGMHGNRAAHAVPDEHHSAAAVRAAARAACGGISSSISARAAIITIKSRKDVDEVLHLARDGEVAVGGSGRVAVPARIVRDDAALRGADQLCGKQRPRQRREPAAM